MQRPKGFLEFRYGWPVVLASTIGIGLGMSPLPFYTIGVFAGELEYAFSWTRAQIMLGLLVFTLTAFVMSPVVGYIADRVGVRRVVLVSIVTFGLTMMAFSLNNGSLPLYLALWGLLAVFGVGTLPITWTRAVSGWFHERRGLALGTALLATGLFGAAAKIFAAAVIEAHGWRMGYLAVGALPIVIAWPVAWFAFRPIDDPKVAHKAAELGRRVPVSSAIKNSGMTLARALRDWRFWLLAAVFLPISFVVGGPIPNLEQIMMTKGFDYGDAVLLAAFVGVSVIVGRLIGGYLLDHMWAPGVSCAILCLPAISCFMLQGTGHTFNEAALAIFILGAAAGVEYDLMAYLVSRYFGIRNYAAIYGALYGFFALGAGIGPYVYGRAYTALGSYDPILEIAGYVFVLASLPLLLLGKYREFDGTEPVVQAEAS